jgi:hypothetical protein
MVSGMRTFSRATNACLAGAVSLLALAANCSPTGDRPPMGSDQPPPIVDDQDATVMPRSVVDASSLDSWRPPPPEAGVSLDASDAGNASNAGDVTVPCSSLHDDAGNAMTMCGTQCVDTQTDRANCGGCDQPCGVTGTSCLHGSCQCPSPKSVCNNACVDTTVDQSNCGFCGHNCQGNPCTGGFCQASSIAQVTTSTVRIGGIAVDSTNVYWTQGPGSSAGAFGKPIAGGAPTSFGPAVDPRGIRVDLTNVYWADFGNGSISSAALLGGSPVKIVPAILDGGTPTGPTAITSDATNVYWVDSTAGTVNQMVLQGGPILPLADNQSTPVAIAVDANNVYWVDYGTSGTIGSVNKVPIGSDAGSVTPLAPSEQQPSGIAVDGTNVYWTDRTNPNGTVKSIPIQGGAINTIAKNQGAPMGVAVDSQYVYWTNYDDNTVLKVPIAGGGTTYTLASGQNNPSAIAVDDKNVYWANQGSGSILKVAK